MEWWSYQESVLKCDMDFHWYPFDRHDCPIYYFYSKLKFDLFTLNKLIFKVFLDSKKDNIIPYNVEKNESLKDMSTPDWDVLLTIKETTPTFNKEQQSKNF